jgi:HKD family nuclease
MDSALKAGLVEESAPTKVVVRLLTNSTAANHLEGLRRCLDSTSKALVFVAYLGRSGFNEIRAAIQVSLARATPVEFFVGGLDQYITDPKALRSLYHLFPPESKSKHLYIAQPDSGCFHPKLYCFMGAKEATLIVGSANMTGGASGPTARHP